MKEPMLGAPKSSSECCTEEDAQDLLDAIEAKDPKALAMVLNRVVEHGESYEEDSEEE